MDMEHQGSENPRDDLYRIRHSLAHVLAQAILKLRPGSTLGFGPPIDDGFYYDFILSEPVSEEDFKEIEKEMRRIIGQGQEFAREELDRDAAMARLEQMGEPYKREYAVELFDRHGIDKLSFFTNGPFMDMCEGPHVATTRQIPPDCFKLRRVAGAYWRGNSDNVMMTRIYAWAFATGKELKERVHLYEEGLKRDHKKLGKELDLFVIDDQIGKGLPLWLPNGTVIRDEIELLAREMEFAGGYQRVVTPHLAKASLYYMTGHLPYYKDSMFPLMEVRERQAGTDGEIEETTESYVLKPMNCPHHHRIFAARMRSYRELPLRLAEYGDVYRYEDSGALSGLLRVRGMSMNDAHIYCTGEQVKTEFLAVMELHRRLYDLLGLTDYHMRFSTWNPDDPKKGDKYLDDPAGWELAQRLVREAMEESGLPYVEGKGEAAFYGPKVDFQFRTVTGREETASTNQLDFGVPARLGLHYTGPDNQDHTPLVIHRAPLGTHERFVAFLIEHYGGAFPTWLAPIQARFLTVADRFDEHARGRVAQLREERIRAELDDSADTVSKKIRNAARAKIPNTIVIGEREQAEGTVTLRRFGSPDQQSMPFAELQDRLRAAIRTRSRDPI
jgi:threonyl-tRNA synthetase